MQGGFRRAIDKGVEMFLARAEFDLFVFDIRLYPSYIRSNPNGFFPLNGMIDPLYQDQLNILSLSILRRSFDENEL